MPESTTSEPANKLEAAKKAFHDFLHEKSPLTSTFELAEKYTKVSREHLVLGKLPARIIHFYKAKADLSRKPY